MLFNPPIFEWSSIITINLNLITTAPSVVYQITLKDKKIINIHNPTDMPAPMKVDYIEEKGLSQVDIEY